MTPIALTRTQFDPGAPPPIGSPTYIASSRRSSGIGRHGSPRDRTSRRRRRGSSPMRASPDAAGAAGVRPAARPGHRRQRPAVRGGRHGHRRWSRHGLECEAPGAAVAAGHGDSRGTRSAAGQLDAVGHHAAVSRLAERTVLSRRRDGHGDGTPLRIGRPEHHLPGPATGPQNGTTRTGRRSTRRPSTLECGRESTSGPPTLPAHHIGTNVANYVVDNYFQPTD